MKPGPTVRLEYGKFATKYPYIYVCECVYACLSVCLSVCSCCTGRPISVHVFACVWVSLSMYFFFYVCVLSYYRLLPDGQ